MVATVVLGVLVVLANVTAQCAGTTMNRRRLWLVRRAPLVPCSRGALGGLFHKSTWWGSIAAQGTRGVLRAQSRYGNTAHGRGLQGKTYRGGGFCQDKFVGEISFFSLVSKFFARNFFAQFGPASGGGGYPPLYSYGV